MEPSVDRQFDAKVQATLWRALGIDPERVERIGDFENYVYRDLEQARVIRVSHSSHRSLEDLEAELHWVGCMAAAGLPLVGPRPVREGQWVLPVVADESNFFACVFDWAEGQRPGGQDWGPDLFRRWGSATARLHRASVDYTGAPGVAQRFTWDKDPHVLDTPARLGPDEELLDAFHALRERLARLPRGKAGFGMIHNDIHQRNFHLHRGELCIFDTDDCCRHWFVQDIAVILFHAMAHPSRHWNGEGNDFARWFFPHFWAGYQREYELDPHWLTEIHDLLLWRSLIMIGVLRHKCVAADPGAREKIGRLRHEVINRAPRIDLDLAALVR